MAKHEGCRRSVVSRFLLVCIVLSTIVKTSTAFELNISRRSALASSSSFLISPFRPPEVLAAPPIAIISEELGYFPVTNRSGETVYVPARVKRQSTEQALELAQHLAKSGAIMYGAYWCPHCQRQKEMFGREAWSLITYVECSPKGYSFGGPSICAPAMENGFPTWKFSKNNIVSGEMPLDRIAKLSSFKGKFDISLETPLPSSMGNSAACS